MTSNKSALSPEQQHFIDEMTRIRGIEFARLGMQVEVDGHLGTISGMINGNLGVTFKDRPSRGAKPVNCHPCWRTKYFDEEGKVIAEYNDDGCVLRPERVPA